MPRVKSSGPMPHPRRSGAVSAQRATGATPFIMTVIFPGEMPPSVRFFAAAGLTAMMRSA